MKVIAIDPGYGRCGIAVLQKIQDKEQLIYSECYETKKEFSLNQRIFDVGQRISQVIEQYTPEFFAIEGLFFSKNTKTAMDVSQSRGVIMYEALRHKLDVYEYTPNQVKIAVTGYGSAKKDDVHLMVSKIITLEEKKYLDDEIDAIAVGITALASIPTQRKHRNF